MIDLLVVFITSIISALLILSLDTNLQVSRLRKEIESLRRYITFIGGASLDSQKIGDEADD